MLEDTEKLSASGIKKRSDENLGNDLKMSKDGGRSFLFSAKRTDFEGESETKHYEERGKNQIGEGES